MTDAADAHIVHELADGVLRITFNRPDVKNALGSTDRLQIVELLDRASEDLHVRAVVLTGSGGSFCSGADLRSPREPLPRPDGAPDVAQGDVGRGIRLYAQRLIVAIMDCEKPVIAAVDGIAAGMGAHIALRVRPRHRVRPRPLHRGVHPSGARARRGRRVPPHPHDRAAQDQAAHVLRRRRVGHRGRAASGS